MKSTPAYSSVMIIDDSDIDNFINQKMIEGCNFAKRIYTHSNPVNALEYLQNIDKITGSEKTNLIPQLIFLNLNMPIMDGFQFLEEFSKLSDSFKDVQIIMLSSSVSPYNIERAKKNGRIRQYVIKPLTTDILQEICNITPYNQIDL